MATSSNTSPLDLAAVKQAIELTHKGRPDEATSVEGTISDPLARKLVEWVILRSDEADLIFLAMPPSSPPIQAGRASSALRRRAEAALWQQQADPRATIAFFGSEPPRSAKGRFALARALLAEGDRAGAQAAVREAWRKDSFSADLEAQARAAFAGLITAADDKARMDARFDVEDDDAGLRAARHLDAAELAIAKARAAVINKSAKAKALLDAVPAAARHDPGYIFSRIQWLRRADKIAEAAQWMIAAPREPEQLGDLDQWWVERRLIARKLLDLGDFQARPTRSPMAPPRRPTRTIAPSSNSPPAGSRCASCASPQLRSPISPASPRASPIRSRSRAPIIGRAAPPRRSGAGRRRAPITKRRHAIRPPITASWRARGLGSTPSLCATLPEPPAEHRRARGRARLRDPLRHR